MSLFSSPQAAIGQVPGWADAEDISWVPISGGWTNDSYRVEVAGASFALRIASPQATLLGVDRRRERTAWQVAAAARIAPRPVHFSEEGNLVTPWLSGEAWRAGCPVDFARVERTVGAVSRIHALPPTPDGYSPIRAIEGCARQVAARGGVLPNSVEAGLERLDGIERELALRADARCLCHHDLSAGNFIDDGALWILDWEYASGGDPMFDWACIVVSHGYDEAQEERMLDLVYPDRGSGLLDRFALTKSVYDLREATWSALMRTLVGADHVLAPQLEASIALFAHRLESNPP